MFDEGVLVGRARLVRRAGEEGHVFDRVAGIPVADDAAVEPGDVEQHADGILLRSQPLAFVVADLWRV